MLIFKPQELEKILGFIIRGGYVFDLTNRSFNEFTKRSVGVEVQSRYADEGLSKGKALTRFLNKDATNEQAVRLLSDLLEYYELNVRGTGLPDDTSRSVEDAQFAKILVKSYEMRLAAKDGGAKPNRLLERLKQSSEEQRLFPHGWALGRNSSDIIRIYYAANFSIHDFVKQGDSIPPHFYPCLVAIDAVAAIVNIDANLKFYLRQCCDLWRPAYTFFASQEMFNQLEQFVEILPEVNPENDMCDYAGEMRDCVDALKGMVDALEVADRKIPRAQALVAVKAFGNAFQQYFDHPNDVKCDENYERLTSALMRVKAQFGEIAKRLEQTELSAPGVVVHDGYHPQMKSSLNRMYEYVMVRDLATVWAKDRSSYRLQEKEKVPEKPDNRPETIESVIADYTKAEEKRAAEKLSKLQALLSANMPILAMSSPTTLKIFSAVRDALRKGTEAMNAGRVDKLHPLQCWPNLLPEVLSTTPSATDFYAVDESDDDPFTLEVELRGGKKGYVASSRHETDETRVLREIKEGLSRYIDAGLMLAKNVRSASYDKWAEATALWDECDNCCSMHQSAPDLMALKEAVMAAVRRLAVDVKVANPEPVSGRGTAEKSDRVGDMPKDQFFSEVKKTVVSSRRMPKGVKTGLTQKELSMLLGFKNADSVRKWESPSSGRKVPLGYSRELRIAGGLPLLEFINGYRKLRGIKKELEFIRDGKIIKLENLTADNINDLHLIAERMRRVNERNAAEKEKKEKR